MMTKKNDKHTKSSRGAKATRTSGTRRRGKKLNPFATRLSAHVTEEEEWITSPPNVTLSRMFLVVLLLHIVIVGGILAFEMFKDEPVPMAPSASAKPLSGNRDALGSELGVRAGESNGVSNSQSYRVQAGDTISQIAKIHNVTSGEIKALNRIGGGDQIFPGQILLVPVAKEGIKRQRVATALPGMVDGEASEIVPASLVGRVQPQPEAPAPPAPPVSPNPSAGVGNPSVVASPPPVSDRTHKVEPGETAFAISRRYGVSVDSILTANGIVDARYLRAGNVIRIP